jgi:3-keto-disaccharide hydrolase
MRAVPLLLLAALALVGCRAPGSSSATGFRPLFDGATLSGWQGLVADPPTRARMSATELGRAQSAADARMREHWSAQGGDLAFDGKGENLCTRAEFAGFELRLEWKIPPGGDSGVYLRGSPQVQIWDNPIGSGGLYNNEKHPSKPLVVADRPPGEWNTFLIRMVGERVTVHLNGVLVTDGVVMENYWERSKPIYSRGPIELQSHGGPLWFRNIQVREVSNEHQ